ncbi:hypothetical protein P8935_23430 [Telmatobacter sp. DSM 110680]|uniref:Uncharacterized protein n=1 Tax=Telmatobacter sp. DSM 110680 TaxID=3036704 RepID=A0AAU7DIH8_9BACT
MKGVFLTRLSILAVAALTLTPFCSAQAKLAGDWRGTFDANGATYQVVWHVTEAPDGTLTSTIDNVTQSIFGTKAKTTTVKGSDVRIEVDDVISPNGQDIPIKGSFDGTLNKEANEVSGTLLQVEPPQNPIQITFKHDAAQSGDAAAGAPAATTQPAIAGDWAGTLTAGPAQLRLVLHITAAKDGSLSATLDSIDQGANGIPINTVTYKDGKVTLDVEAVHGNYEGTVSKDASGIDGTWTQGQPLPLSFKRAQPQAAPKPATPTNIDGTWTGKLDTGAATLTINLKIANMDTGLTAQLQSPDQAPNWAPATSIKRDGEKLTVEFSAFSATFEGTISADHNTIDGAFTQMGHELPLVLKKN